MVRKFNFNAGPATLPLSVLETIQTELVDFQGLGMSILEISHRSKEFTSVLENTKNTLREVLAIPENYDILFLTGGASLQFAMIPMNLLKTKADYVNTGSWSKKAIKEAKKIGEVHIAGTSEQDNFDHIPQDLVLSNDTDYVHITSNNTIFGTQWHNFPEVGDTPLVVDMSSDILSRRLDISKFAIVYAGAQKNAGPSGVTIVIMRKDLLADNDKIPIILQYKTHADKDSCYNTPPVFQIYAVGLIANWIKELGGLEAIEKLNNQKTNLLYGAIDKKSDYYRGTAAKESRSQMNVTFRLPSEELEAQFIKEAATHNLHGLKGHRSVGGIRVSMYNAMPVEGVQKLVEFMDQFAEQNKT